MGMFDEISVGHHVEPLTTTEVLFGDEPYRLERYASFWPEAFPDPSSGGSQSTPTSRQPVSVREL